MCPSIPFRLYTPLSQNSTSSSGRGSARRPQRRCSHRFLFCSWLRLVPQDIPPFGEISVNKDDNYSQNKRLGRGTKPRQDQGRAVASQEAGIIGLRKRLKLLKFYPHQDRRNSPNRPRPTIQYRSRTSKNVHFVSG